MAFCFIKVQCSTFISTSSELPVIKIKIQHLVGAKPIQFENEIFELNVIDKIPSYPPTHLTQPAELR